MKRTLLTSCLVLFLVPFTACAEGEGIQEGRDYELLLTPVPTATGDRVEVLELFWYGCPHCYQFEPHVKKWLEDKPEGAEFRRMPAVLGKSWLIHAQAYYTAEALGVLDTMHEAIFRAMHRDKLKLRTEDEMAEFFAENGVPEERFRKVFKSFGVQTKVQQASARVRAYRITGVPTVIVNGKYRVKSGDRLFEVVDYLVGLERKATAANEG